MTPLQAFLTQAKGGAGGINLPSTSGLFASRGPVAESLANSVPVGSPRGLPANFFDPQGEVGAIRRANFGLEPVRRGGRDGDGLGSASPLGGGSDATGGSFGNPTTESMADLFGGFFGAFKGIADLATKRGVAKGKRGAGSPGGPSGGSGGDSSGSGGQGGPDGR